jgi:WD40-like Beta Propeller Repeat
MIDDHDVREMLQRRADAIPVPPVDTPTAVRRARRRLVLNGAVATVATAAIAVATFAGVDAIRSAPIPADDPTPTGVFAPVAGRIVYENEAEVGDPGYDLGLWAIAPSGPSDTAAGPSVADDVASTLVRLDVEEATPLGWSSDGTELLFSRPDAASAESLFPMSHLYILHADGSETRLNRDPMMFGGATISPDGTRVVFAAWGDDLGLWVVDAEGGRPARLPFPAAEGIVADPTFSPDGTQIAYVDSGESENHLWVMDADGGNAQEILAHEATVFGAGGLQWSPAGDRIVAQGGLSDGTSVIYTFAPDGSDFRQIITGGLVPYWSPDGSQIAYTIECEPSDTSCGGLAIADVDGSNIREFGYAASGPWHPGAGGGEDEDVLDPTPSRFVGQWASTDYSDGVYGDASHQMMTIRAGEDDVLHITVQKDVSDECGEKQPGRRAHYRGTTMSGSGRLEGMTTLVVPSPLLACDDGSKLSAIQEGLSNYTLILDLATSRLYDSLGGVWNRGALAESRTGVPTERGVGGPGTFSILYGEVTFRAAEPWIDHAEAYIDPRTFFLIGPGDEGAEAQMTILVNPLPPEAPCDRRVPPAAEELVQAIRSNPDLEATAPVIERVGGIDALRMDVVAAPGASDGPCTHPLANVVDVVSVPGRPWASVGPGDLGRLYVLDLPGGSARTLAIWITAPDTAVFEQAVDTAAPVLDSFEFHAP